MPTCQLNYCRQEVHTCGVTVSWKEETVPDFNTSAFLFVTGMTFCAKRCDKHSPNQYHRKRIAAHARSGIDTVQTEGAVTSVRNKCSNVTAINIRMAG